MRALGDGVGAVGAEDAGVLNRDPARGTNGAGGASIAQVHPDAGLCVAEVGDDRRAAEGVIASQHQRPVHAVGGDISRTRDRGADDAAGVTAACGAAAPDRQVRPADVQRVGAASAGHGLIVGVEGELLDGDVCAEGDGAGSPPEDDDVTGVRRVIPRDGVGASAGRAEMRVRCVPGAAAPLGRRVSRPIHVGRVRGKGGSNRRHGDEVGATTGKELRTQRRDRRATHAETLHGISPR